MTELAAETPAERADELIRLTERLTALIEQETALFRDRRPHQAGDLQAEKTRLAAIYRTETRLAAQDASRLAGLDATTKARLTETTRAVEAALAENGAAVDAMKVVTEGVVKAIADEAARQTQTDAGYGASGRQSGKVGAIACNQTV